MAFKYWNQCIEEIYPSVSACDWSKISVYIIKKSPLISVYVNFKKIVDFKDIFL